ncbi:hypothetical protein MRB53_040146 [Persea americana]|nr:hypothetical protein MRB53_040146 [Persea americana]
MTSSRSDLCYRETYFTDIQLSMEGKDLLQKLLHMIHPSSTRHSPSFAKNKALKRAQGAYLQAKSLSLQTCSRQKHNRQKEKPTRCFRKLGLVSNRKLRFPVPLRGTRTKGCRLPSSKPYLRARYPQTIRLTVSCESQAKFTIYEVLQAWQEWPDISGCVLPGSLGSISI